MQYFKVVFWTALSVILAVLLENGISLGDRDIPGIGKLLNPHTGVWNIAERKPRKRVIDLSTHGIENEVRIIYDHRLVPHIYASNLEDALFAQGYTESAHRMWQMDFLGREAAGRLSEILGERTIQNDIRRRKEGLLYGAELAVKQWQKDPQSMAALEPYIRGINAHLNSVKEKDLPLEFRLLDYKPDQWTILQSALIFKSMSSTLASYNEDIEAANTLMRIGLDTFDRYFPVHDPLQSPVIPRNENFQFPALESDVARADIYRSAILEGYTPEKGIPGIGSNNWALAGSKTASGYPLLCNDPHLRLTLPSIWYEIHISTPEFNAYGVTFPGIPGIMIGFNENIAWGNTNVGQDFVDHYAIHWTNAEQTEYRAGEKVFYARKREERIKVRDGEDIVFHLKQTPHGIIYRESPNDTLPALARDWIGYTPHGLSETRVFVDAMKSKNYNEFKQATNNFFAPAQNFLFASRQDTVALRVNGQLPLRAYNESRFVALPPDAIRNGKAWIPRDHNPETINPSRGYASSANQVSTGSEYPYYYHGSFEEYRGKRVNQMLDNMTKAGTAEMKNMQLDVYSLKAGTFLPRMLQALEGRSYSDSVTSRAIVLLKNWDKKYTARARGPKIFEQWFSVFQKAYWSATLGLDDAGNFLFPEDWMLLRSMDERRTLTDSILRSSFTEILAGRNMEYVEQEWSDYRPKSIEHYLSIPAFSHNNLSLGGCGHVLNAISSSIGPSWRMIVELEDSIRGYGIFPGGQSGDPSSRYYDNNMAKWVDGEYNQLDIYKKHNDWSEDALYSLTFKPAAQ